VRIGQLQPFQQPFFPGQLHRIVVVGNIHQ
jgi:hypothetical protein